MSTDYQDLKKVNIIICINLKKSAFYLIHYHLPDAPPPPNEPPPPPPKPPKPPNPPIPPKPDLLGPPKIIGGPPHQYHEERLQLNRYLNKKGNIISAYNSEKYGF